MSRISDVLRKKGTDVITMSPQAPLSALLDRLAHRNIGAVVVTEDGSKDAAVAGIVSERDVVHAMYEGSANLNDPISKIMTSSVVTCVPEDKVDHLMRTMTERRIRHLPVVVDGKLTGIVSIGDMVKARIGELEQEREQLHSSLAAGS